MVDHGAKFSLGRHAASIWSGISVVGCIQDTVCHDMLFFSEESLLAKTQSGAKFKPPGPKANGVFPGRVE